jgi:hypothetical protein
MIIRVAAKDVENAKLLVEGLVSLFGGEAVSLQSGGDVHVHLNGNSGQQAMTQTLASVERWLEETGTGFTEVWVDEREYRMELPRSLDQVL